jgi:hypothetical protein
MFGWIENGLDNIILPTDYAYLKVAIPPEDVFLITSGIAVSINWKLSFETILNLASQSSLPFENVINRSKGATLAYEQLLVARGASIPFGYEQLIDVNSSQRMVYEALGVLIVSVACNLPYEQILNLTKQGLLGQEQIVNLLSGNKAVTEQLSDVKNAAIESIEKTAAIARNALSAYEQIVTLAAKPTLSLEAILNLLSQSKEPIENLANVKNNLLISRELLSRIVAPSILPYSFIGNALLAASGSISFTAITAEVLWSSYWVAADTDRDVILKSQEINPQAKLPKNVTLATTIAQAEVLPKLLVDARGNNYFMDIAIDPFVYSAQSFVTPAYTTQRMYNVLVRHTRFSYFTFNSDLTTYQPILQRLNPSAFPYPLGVKAHGPVLGEISVQLITEYPLGRVVGMDF